MRHGAVQLQRLNPPFGKLMLQLFQVRKSVLRDPGRKISRWLRRWRNRRVAFQWSVNLRSSISLNISDRTSSKRASSPSLRSAYFSLALSTSATAPTTIFHFHPSTAARKLSSCSGRLNSKTAVASTLHLHG